MLEFSVVVGKFVFIVLIFVVISAGYVTDILSCQTQKWLKTSIYARHLIGVIMVFVFIMMEGGWDFDEKRENAEANNWLSGNTLHTLVFAVMLYFIFFISSKSQLIPNLLFFFIILVIYIINTYREYILVRKEIDDDYNQYILNVEYSLLTLSGITLTYGFIEYIFYQMGQRGKNFDWYKFLLGVPVCSFESKLKM